MMRELTNRELLDRYIHSVKTLLPPDKADDIAAEISSNLQSLVEDRTMDLGRELQPDEVSAILKQHGHPSIVAGKYRDQPAWGFRSGVFSALLVHHCAPILGLVFAIRIIVAAFAFRGTETAGTILLQLGRDLLVGGLYIIASVTLVFAACEYVLSKFGFSESSESSERWKPESLPPVPPSIRQPRLVQPRPVVQITGGAVWLLFFAMALFWPRMFWVWGPAGVFSPSATVYVLRLPMWLLALSGLSEMWLNHTRFAAAEWRPFLRIAVSIAGVALVIALLRGGDLLLAGSKWDPAQAQTLGILNGILAGALVLISMLLGLLCVYELCRLVRRLGRDRQTADSVS